MTPKRPVLRYHGGKWRIAPWILEHFPPHVVYVEPFGGAASVLMQKARAKAEVYNDLDESVVSLFRVLRDPDGAAELERRLALTPFARADYEDWCYEVPEDALDAAHRLIARSFMGQSSKGVWQKSGFDTRVNPDGFVSRANALKDLPETVRAVSARLLGVIIERDDAVALIRRHDRPDALFYVDPPYVASTRSVNIYRHDMSDNDHRALATVLREAVGMVVLSGYPSDLYDQELYPDWCRVMRSARADGGHERVEVLWLNPAAVAARGHQLHLQEAIATP